MGRKKMKTVDKFDIRLRVDEALHKRIAKAAESRGVSVAAYIRFAVTEKIERDEPKGAKH